jgi:hypothetical protein
VESRSPPMGGKNQMGVSTCWSCRDQMPLDRSVVLVSAMRRMRLLMTKGTAARDKVADDRELESVTQNGAHAGYVLLLGGGSCSVHDHVRCLMCWHYLRGRRGECWRRKCSCLVCNKDNSPGRTVARSMGRPAVLLILHRWCRLFIC